MKYISRRNKKEKVSFDNAIKTGISSEGGLFVPEKFAAFTKEQIKSLEKMNYIERACFVLSGFMEEYTYNEIKTLVENAYTGGKFDKDEIAYLNKVNSDNYVLELWHGPTCAFKDMALQLLPHFMTSAMKRTNEDKQIVILVATSGDTGKAALEGFCDVEGTKIIVYYPSEGVSNIQKLQMNTQAGDNVQVFGINGNFDDAQSAVKEIFTSDSVKQALNRNKMVFSSANSINWGRLVPQIVYYFSAYADMLKMGEIKNGEKINFVVPTGNFGNILAAYYAKKMGLPVNKLICASNANKVLTDFINTGVYNKNRSFYQTISPSMDILISSNLERLLFDLSGENDALISSLMSELKVTGEYKVTKQVQTALKKDFYAGFADDEQTKKTIYDMFIKTNYLCDTHTAVAINVYEQYKAKTGDKTKSVIVSTASPYKFSDNVLAALKGEDNIYDSISQRINSSEKTDDFDIICELEEISKTCAPENLSTLKEKQVRFDTVIDKKDICQSVFDALNIK